MIRINDIIEKVSQHIPEADIDIIDRAYVYSARVHQGQIRLSGEPYLSHPLEVAGIIADMRLDAISVAAGLLHDVVEDTHSTEQEIRETFGEQVAHIVSGVTKISSLSFENAQVRQAESIRKMILAMANDIRVILIKLADRMHNMRTLQFHGEEKRRSIAQETIDIYAPLAARLGIYWIKHELEDSAFLYLFPQEYQKIKSMVAEDQTAREEYIESVKNLLAEKMAASGLKCEVLGRYKKFYSIYQKMKAQNLTFEEVYDIIAFRIILDTIPQCYEALGHIHGMWRPVPQKIKDYISMPKPNMYQSLHTTVIGPLGQRCEIQIRTHSMDQVAKSGIAAHWSYKEGKDLDERATRTFAWIQSLVDNSVNIHDPDEFMEHVRIDLFPDDVYVFTPTGEIKSLPKDATPVDFAYMIHSEIGDQCTGAKVNGRMVPLNHCLQTGDSVSIITSKNHHPSRDWLTFVKTAKARMRIRQWIKAQERDRSVSLGREMCEKAFRKYRLNFSNLIKAPEIDEVVASFGFKTLDDLMASVGFGKTTPNQVVNKFQPKTEEIHENDSIIGKLFNRVRKKKETTGILVRGLEDILIRFGKCCQPVPGDSIVGYITQGHGVTVHRSNCVNVMSLTPERKIQVEWVSESGDQFEARIYVAGSDRVGLLADLTGAITKCNANISSANTKTLNNHTVDCQFDITVNDLDHLNKVLTAIRKLKSVQTVKRMDA
jgi:guanosine-3',5'-bis(diphosphate) 3'-pyrophosphohydrolase